MNVKARMFKNNRQVMLYLDIKGNAGGCGEAGQALSPAPSLFPWQQ